MFPLSFILMVICIIQVNVIKFILKEEIADPDQAALEESATTLLTEEEEKA